MSPPPAPIATRARVLGVLEDTTYVHVSLSRSWLTARLLPAPIPSIPASDRLANPPQLKETPLLVSLSFTYPFR